MFKVLLCVAHQHDWRLVALAAFVCAAAATSTFFLYSKTPLAPAPRRWTWLALSGIAAGCGVWTTHFVAMLAFETGLPTAYDLGPTLASLGLSIASITLGLAVGAVHTSGRRNQTAAIAGGLVVGLGVTAMHYVGMQGYRTAGWIAWNGIYVAASIGIGAAFSAAAMAIGRPGSRNHEMLQAAGLLALAIVGMHFTGMTAVTVVPDATIVVPASDISDRTLATIAVAVTAVILMAAVTGAALDAAGRFNAVRRLREALDAMPDAVAIFDDEDRLTAWNTPYAEICRTAGDMDLIAGARFSDLIGQGLSAGAFPDAVGRETDWLAEIRGLHAGDRPSVLQRTRDGRWLHITVRRTNDGGRVSTWSDVTELKRAEAAVAQSEERFRRLAVNAPEIIAEARLDGVLTYISPASLAITGFTPEELIGRPFTELAHPEDGPKVMAMCRAVFDSKGKLAPWAVEFRAARKTGEEIWLECKPTLALDAHTGRYVGLTDVIRDITPRKRLEAELRAARAVAEAASAVKSEFLANMSHELRTPLTSIIGFTGLAAEQSDLSPLTREYVDRVGEASRALLCTVNDILEFSKLEAGQVAIHPKPCPVAPLFRGALDLFAPQAGAKDVRLVLDHGESVRALTASIDADRVRQVLLNLVSNAVKFTAEGSVTLRTRYHDETASLKVEVVDTGPGLTAEQQGRLFQRFSQIDGSLTRQGGTGLGLAICKGLIEAMGGEIGVDSRLGQGSCFWFRIPAPSVAAAGAQVAEDAENAPARLNFDGVRVLVVDDHATNRELVRLFLSGVGAEVSEAADGLEAVQAAGEWPFDVILMDLRMPRLDGAAALARIRGQAGPNDATPILAFTADATAEVSERLLTEGFDDVVPKPLEPAALIAAIARATTFAHPSQTAERVLTHAD